VGQLGIIGYHKKRKKKKKKVPHPSRPIMISESLDDLIRVEKKTISWFG